MDYLESSEYTNEMAVQAIRAYLSESGISQEKLARAVGVSGAAMSQFLRGSYPAPQKITMLVKEFFDRNEKRKLTPKAPAFALTSLSNDVIQTLEYCRLLKVCGLVFGDAGVGKTMGIREYARNNEGTLIITASPINSSKIAINELIARELGVKVSNARKTLAGIKDKLKGSDKIIVIDEAQHLTYQTIDSIRCIADEADISICFIGNKNLYHTVNELDQVRNRMPKMSELKFSDIKKSDIELIFKGNDIDKDSIDFIYKVSITRQGIRGAVHLYVATVAMFEMVTLENLAKVARQMKIA